MKGKKLLAVLLAALMTASSVSITAFAEDENSEQPKAVENTNENVEQSNEENDIVLFGAEAPGVNTYAVQIGEDGYDSLDEAMNSLSERTGDIVIKLSGTVSYEYNAHKDFTKSYTGGTITFEGIGENRSTVLNLYGKDSDATPIENDTKLIFRNLTINKTNNEDDGSAAWNRHAINFEGGVEFEDVNVNTEVAVGDASTFTNVNFTEANAQYCLWIKSSASGEIVVDGCSFTATSGGRGIKVADQYAGNNSKTVSLTVKNSTFNTAKKAAVLVSNVKGADITAYGNDISNVSEDNANLVWIDDGENDQEVSYSESINKIIVRDENGKIVNAVRVENGNVVTKTVVATVNDLECANLQNAVDLAKDNDEIKLVSDIVIKADDLFTSNVSKTYYSYCIFDGKTLTLNLNGNKISYDQTVKFDEKLSNLSSIMMFRINNGTNLTITGNGTIDASFKVDDTKSVSSIIFPMNNGNTLAIENGTYKLCCPSAKDRDYSNNTNLILIWNGGGNAYIKGGTFELPEKPSQTFNVAGSSMADNKRIVMTGGTLVGGDPRYTGDGSAVAENYTVSKFGDNYTVIAEDDAVATLNASNKTYSYTSLADAIANANDGDTVTLTKNASGDGIAIYSNTFAEKGITIDLNDFTYTVTGNLKGSAGSLSNAIYFESGNKITVTNGTLTSSETALWDSKDGNTYRVAILVQNHSDSLTLENVKLDGSNLRDELCSYTLSNDNGNVNITNSTVIANNDGKDSFAFDVDNSKSKNHTVTVTNSVIDGFVEISGNDGKDAKLVSGTNEYKENGTYVQSGDKFIKAEKRSIEISAAKTEVEMGDTVTISVTLNGNNLANAVYDLEYDTSKFELTSASTGTTANNGVFSEMLYKDDGTCYENGKAIATYTFKALGQTEDVIADFVISNTAAATYLESIDATNIKTTSNEKVSVAINLKNYEVTVNVDGSAVSEDTLNVPYTNEGHTFSVTATPAATVSYKVNGGDETDSVSVSERGTYTIEYTITPATGYAKVTGTFTLVIGDPEYVVEVNLTNAENRDYVSGKKIVLVYTNTNGLAFNYGDDLMIDVTARGYKYNGTDEYSHVYAFVTDAIESSDAEVTVEDYSKNISCVIPSPAELVKLTYSMDLNFDDNLNVQDITTAYGIYNVNADYFKNVKYQKNILRADTDGNKCVNNDDANTVVDAVKNK